MAAPFLDLMCDYIKGVTDSINPCLPYSIGPSANNHITDSQGHLNISPTEE